MLSIVQGLTTIPGVMGSMLSDEQGEILAHSFPSIFDQGVLKEVADLLFDTTNGLQDITGGVRSFELRYELGRIVIKPLPGMFLLILCQPSVNIQMLYISLNVAIKKLEKRAASQALFPATQPAPLPASAEVVPVVSEPKRHAGRTHNAPAYSDYRAQSDDKGVLLECELVKKTAGTFWESMTENCSVNRNTALEISNYFETGPFKKLTVTNLANGLSKRVPVNVILHDRDHAYDGKILLTLALSEFLKVDDGDQVRVEIIAGGGILGWEGI